jgi:hypothetical protein
MEVIPGILEKQSVSSIGAIAISDSDPNVIYAGTEACIRGNISHETECTSPPDAGKTWTNVGCELSLTW